jgi:hypothetical protein
MANSSPCGPFEDPDYWQRRAAVMRRIAGDARDPDFARMMLKLAVDYDGLARQTEERRAENRTQAPRSRNVRV